MKNKEYLYSEKYILCEPLEEYARQEKRRYLQCTLQFPNEANIEETDIRIIELFAGVGGFRIGLERASKRYKTVWSNQWEPSTKKQDASELYIKNFGLEGHSNLDISSVSISEIPEADLLVGGFPCQDYSVATTLKNSKGLYGKKGILWWQIYRILNESIKKPNYLLLENVDRLLISPSNQRGRDFAIILASLSELGYDVEWRVINAADYGMPQKRKRTYILAYHKDSPIYAKLDRSEKYNHFFERDSLMTKSFPAKFGSVKNFKIEGDLDEISESFNMPCAAKGDNPFYNAGYMHSRNVYTTKADADYDGNYLLLKDIIQDESEISDEFFIKEDELERWKYLKGGKSEKRINKLTGFEYNYSEGSMSFPDKLDSPSRTIITGEGGRSASRFKHVVLTNSGRYRRLTPIELERLNMFPDNHTLGVTNAKRAFLMGNALVTGIVERIGYTLITNHETL